MQLVANFTSTVFSALGVDVDAWEDFGKIEGKDISDLLGEVLRMR